MMRARRLLLAAALAIAVASSALPASGGALAPGDLDPTFGQSGKVILDIADYDYGHAVAVDSQDRVIVAGSSSRPQTFGDITVARFLEDGKVDPSFGTEGVAWVDIEASGDDAYDVVIDDLGRIVVAGQTTAGASPNNFLVARFDSNGNLDEAFGSGGTVVTDIDGLDNRAAALALDSQGRIVVVGTCEPVQPPRIPDFCTVRYDEDGDLDQTFGIGGTVRTTFGPGTYEGASAVAIDSDDRPVVVGAIHDDMGHDNVAQARYEEDGDLDPSFDEDGKLVSDLSGGAPPYHADFASSVAIDGQGRIVIAGGAQPDNATYYDFAVARYLADGSLDPSFDQDGIQTTAMYELGDRASDLAFDSAQRIVVVGLRDLAGFGAPLDTAAARYLEDGSLDSAFGDSGKVLLDFGNAYESLASVAVDSRDRIVLAGWTGSADPGDYPVFTAARIIGDVLRSCTIVGTNDADILPGSSAADIICAFTGNDTIAAAEGNDIVLAGGGADTATGGLAADGIDGGAGGDDLKGGGGKDRIWGRGGRDALYGGSGPDVLLGGPGRDVCFGGPGEDILKGCEG